MSRRPERETDPYGHISWALSDAKGRGDLICFDYYVNPIKKTARIHSVVNSETAHFIQDFANVVVPLDEALAEAHRQIDDAIEWFQGQRFVGKRTIARFLKLLATDLGHAGLSR